MCSSDLGAPSASAVAAKADEGFTMVGQTHANIETYQRQGTTQSATAKSSTALVKDFIEATNQSGLWLSLIEDDSSGVGRSRNGEDRYTRDLALRQDGSLASSTTRHSSGKKGFWTVLPPNIG